MGINLLVKITKSETKISRGHIGQSNVKIMVKKAPVFKHCGSEAEVKINGNII
jgi:hypothetical protein